MGYQKIATFLASICTRFISEMILDRTLVTVESQQELVYIKWCPFQWHRNNIDHRIYS